MDAQDEPSRGRPRAPPRSRRPGSGWSSRPRPAGRPRGGRSPGSGRRRRSRRARRATPRPRPSPGQADRERHRGGVVVRDQRILGAGQRDEVLLGDAEAAPRRPVARSSSSRSGRPRPHARPRSPPRPGRAPRLVCITTPVALITAVGPLPGRVVEGLQPRHDLAAARQPAVAAPPPAASRARSSSTTAGRPPGSPRHRDRRRPAERRRARARRSEVGGEDRLRAWSSSWRERMGV